MHYSLSGKRGGKLCHIKIHPKQRLPPQAVRCPFLYRVKFSERGGERNETARHLILENPGKSRTTFGEKFIFLIDMP
jgi:hypothetical protein